MGRITHLLVHSMEVTRNDQPVDNGQGGWIPARRTVYSATACRVTSMNNQERLVEQQRGSFNTHKIFTEADIEIQPDDEIAVDGWTYRVQSDYSPSLPYFATWLAQSITRAVAG